MHPPKPPASLIKTQQWLSTAIRTLDPIQRELADAESGHYLTRSTFLDSQERLKIYISDYWPRCLDALEADFPGLRRWMGNENFRIWMTSYLDAYPSRSFTLSHLGQDLLPFLKTAYTQRDQAQVIELARYEWATLFAAFAPHKPAFNSKKYHQDPKALTQMRFRLQPHLSLLHLTYDWPTWISNDTLKKPKKKECYLAIFQQNDYFESYTLTKGGYLLLTEIDKGYPLHLAIEKAFSELTPKEAQTTESTLQTLFKDTVQLQWLTKRV